MTTHHPPYAYPNKGCLLVFLILLLLSLLAGLAQLHTFFTYQTYHPGRCTITSATTNTHTPGFSKGASTFYTADFEFTVATSDGQKVQTSGSASPYDDRYSSFDDAQQTVDRYSVKHVYNCWYNPTDPTHAVLDFRGFNATSAIFNYLETCSLYLLGFCFLALLYHNFSIGYRLRRRGVLTRGRVVEHILKQGRSGKVTYSRILYSPLDLPLHSYQIEQAGAYPLNSLQPICYDAHEPALAQYGGRPRLGPSISYMLALIIGVLIAVAIFAAIWFGA